MVLITLVEGHPRNSPVYFYSKSIHWFRQRSRLKVFLFFLALVSFYSTERNGLSNFGKRLTKEQSCEIILKFVHRLSRRNRLKPFFLFIALAAILFNGGERFD